MNGRDAEDILGNVEITVNKNMVPFDTESPFVTSGIRIGTAAITSRGIDHDSIPQIVSLIDRALMNPNNKNIIKDIRSEIHETMAFRPLFKW